jgi:hypothetical protein
LKVSLPNGPRALGLQSPPGKSLCLLPTLVLTAHPTEIVMAIVECWTFNVQFEASLAAARIAAEKIEFWLIGQWLWRPQIPTD